MIACSLFNNASAKCPLDGFLTQLGGKTMGKPVTAKFDSYKLEILKQE